MSTAPSLSSLPTHIPQNGSRNHRYKPQIGEVAWTILSKPFMSSSHLILSGVKIFLIKAVVLPAVVWPNCYIRHITKKFEDFWNLNIPIKEPASLIEQYTEIRKQYRGERHTTQMPDGTHLHIYLIRPIAAESSPKTRINTILFFAPNFELGVSLALDLSFVEQALQLKTACNFVFFDYPGTGNSKRKLKSPKDLLASGIAMVKWIEETLKTPPDHIGFYGLSLGGAIAAQTQASSPTLTGPHFNDRSFASLSLAANAVISKKHGRNMGNLAARIIKATDLEIDAKSSFDRLTGIKAIFYSPEDRTIFGTGQLSTHFPDDYSIKLQGRSDLEWIKKEDPHNLPLAAFTDFQKICFDLIVQTFDSNPAAPKITPHPRHFPPPPIETEPPTIASTTI